MGMYKVFCPQGVLRYNIDISSTAYMSISQWIREFGKGQNSGIKKAGKKNSKAKTTLIYKITNSIFLCSHDIIYIIDCDQIHSRPISVYFVQTPLFLHGCCDSSISYF